MQAKLNTPRVPFSITRDVKKLVAKVKENSETLYVAVRPEPWAIVNECFPNVRRMVNEHGGRIQYGWAIWQCEMYFVEAEHHAVFDPRNGAPFVDITPQDSGVDRILFLPDDDAVYGVNTTNQTDNIRMALVNDRRVHRMLELFSSRTALLNSIPAVGGAVTLRGEKAREMVAIQREIADIQNDLKSSQSANIWSTR